MSSLASVPTTTSSPLVPTTVAPPEPSVTLTPGDVKTGPNEVECSSVAVLPLQFAVAAIAGPAVATTTPTGVATTTHAAPINLLNFTAGSSPFAFCQVCL